MTLAETNRIDITAESPTGEILLVIVASRDWSRERVMLRELSEKVHNYVSYIKSSRYKQEFGDKPAKICLMTFFEPTDEVKTLVDKASAATQIPIEIDTRSLEL